MILSNLFDIACSEVFLCVNEMTCKMGFFTQLAIFDERMIVRINKYYGVRFDAIGIVPTALNWFLCKKNVINRQLFSLKTNEMSACFWDNHCNLLSNHKD